MLEGHETDYRGWTIYLHEKLGVVVGLAVNAEGHESRMCEVNCRESRIKIETAAETVYKQVQDSIDAHIKAEEDAAAEAKKKPVAKAPGKKPKKPTIPVSLF